jgi:hypothetical protein
MLKAKTKNQIARDEDTRRIVTEKFQKQVRSLASTDLAMAHSEVTSSGDFNARHCR